MLIPDQITRDGNPITNNLVCVGQQINLTNMITGIPASAISSWGWTIPGATGNTNSDTAIYDYQPTAENCNYTNLIVPTNYTTNATGGNLPFCHFYWTAPGTNQVVMCTATIYGQPTTMSAAFNVVKPTVNISAQTTPTTIYDELGGYYRLVFGNDETGTNGIMFQTNNYTLPPGISGTLYWNQVLSSDSFTATTPTGPFTVASSGYDGTTNNWYPYHSFINNGANPVDSPQSGVLRSLWNTYSRNFNATMYATWKATPASVGGDQTIEVPLKGIQYSWVASATNTAPTNSGGGQWELIKGTESLNQIDFDVTSEPQWQTNAAFNHTINGH